MRKLRTFRSLNMYETHGFGVAAIAAGIGAAGSIASSAISGSMGADAAGGAAGLQKEYLDLGINELRGALTPSMQRLAKAQGWSDSFLKMQLRNSMAGTRPYAQAGAQGLRRLNYLMGTDNGLGPQPTAPTAPKQPKALKPPVYSKDPKTAAGQKTKYDQAVAAQALQYKKAMNVFERAKVKFATDTEAWQAGTTAQQNDPEYGSLMKPYDDRFEGRIDEVAGRKYEDTHGYGQKILDTAAEKYDDKYAQEILDTARDKFETDDFEADPGYEFRRSEGGRGIEQSAAARGSVLSGGTLKELTGYNQNLASDEFDRAHGRWADQRNAHLAGVTGQQAFDYGAWGDNKNTRLGALGGERAFDYGVFGDQKNTELGSLVDRRNFDFGNFTDNRNFQTGALQNMVGVGQQATDDQNQIRQFYGGQRTGNALTTANQLGAMQLGTAQNIAEFLSQSGNAQAAGQVGAANAYSGAVQGIGNTLGTMAGYYYGNQPGSGQRRSAPGAPEWWRQNQGVPT
jgi:hypothetical protein